MLFLFDGGSDIAPDARLQAKGVRSLTQLNPLAFRT